MGQCRGRVWSGMQRASRSLAWGVTNRLGGWVGLAVCATVRTVGFLDGWSCVSRLTIQTPDGRRVVPYSGNRSVSTIVPTSYTAPMHVRCDALPLRHTVRRHRCEPCFRRGQQQPPRSPPPQCAVQHGESSSSSARRRPTSLGHGQYQQPRARTPVEHHVVRRATPTSTPRQGLRVVAGPHARSNTSLALYCLYAFAAAGAFACNASSIR